MLFSNYMPCFSELFLLWRIEVSKTYDRHDVDDGIFDADNKKEANNDDNKKTF